MVGLEHDSHRQSHQLNGDNCLHGIMDCNVGHNALQDWGLLDDWMYKKCSMTVWKGNPLLKEISFAIVAITLKSRGCHQAIECCCLKIPSRMVEITELLYWIKLDISPVS